MYMVVVYVCVCVCVLPAAVGVVLGVGDDVGDGSIHVSMLTDRQSL